MVGSVYVIQVSVVQFCDTLMSSTVHDCVCFATEAHPLSEAEAAAQGDVLFDIITENHQFSSADGVVYADYEEVDDVTSENYRRLIRELNLRDFGRADR